MIRGVLKVFFGYRLVVGADNFTVALDFLTHPPVVNYSGYSSKA